MELNFQNLLPTSIKFIFLLVFIYTPNKQKVYKTNVVYKFKKINLLYYK